MVLSRAKQLSLAVTPRTLWGTVRFGVLLVPHARAYDVYTCAYGVFPCVRFFPKQGDVFLCRLIFQKLGHHTTMISAITCSSLRLFSFIDSVFCSYIFRLQSNFRSLRILNRKVKLLSTKTFLPLINHFPNFNHLKPSSQLLLTKEVCFIRKKVFPLLHPHKDFQ